MQISPNPAQCGSIAAVHPSSAVLAFVAELKIGAFTDQIAMLDCAKVSWIGSLPLGSNQPPGNRAQRVILGLDALYLRRGPQVDSRPLSTFSSASDNGGGTNDAAGPDATTDLSLLPPLDLLPA